MLPSELVHLPSSLKMLGITSPNDLWFFQKLEKDIAFNQVTFNCSPEDTHELGSTECLARLGEIMKQKMQFYIPIYYPMTYILYRIVCIYSSADIVLSIYMYTKLHSFASL